MDNLRTIFSNEHFSKSFKNALELNEYKKLLNCFLYMAIWEKKQVDFLFLFFEADLKDSTANMYFRNNSSASRLFLDYVFQFASDWLVCSLVPFFEQLYFSTDLLNNTEPSSDENGPTDSPEQSKPQIETDILLKCLVAALDGINKNLEHCPLTLRQLFHVIQCEIERMHPNFNESKTDKQNDSSTTTESQGGLRYRLLTNLVLFRFFCAVMNSRGERQDDFLRKISENIRKKNDSTLADFPKRPLTTKEKEAMAQQLESESQTICRLSSLSRRFNEVLEFLTRLQEEPSYFVKIKQDYEASSCHQKLTKFHVISQELSAIIDEINSKKSCNNQTLIERL